MTIKAGLSCAVLALGLATPSWAGDGWERDSRYNQLFNPQAVTTVSGTLESIDRDCRPLKDMEAGFAATIKTSSGERIQVQVGPIWFTSFYRQRWNVQVGDQVEATGSRVLIEGHPVIMAVKVAKGNLKMAVRGKTGIPLWDLQVEDF